MRERALTLDGKLGIEERAGGGTRVRLQFRHRSSREIDPAVLGTAAAIRV